MDDQVVFDLAAAELPTSLTGIDIENLANIVDAKSSTWASLSTFSSASCPTSTAASASSASSAAAVG
jgi:hypothetical protein